MPIEIVAVGGFVFFNSSEDLCATPADKTHESFIVIKEQIDGRSRRLEQVRVAAVRARND